MFFLQSFALKSPNLQVDRENGDDQWDLGKRFLLEEKRPTQKPILIDNARNTKRKFGSKKGDLVRIIKLPARRVTTFVIKHHFLVYRFVINSSDFGIEWD